MPGSVGQVIAVSVLPGPLRVTPASMRIVLERVSSDRYRGRLPTIDVVDARGNLAGWTLYLVPASENVELRVRPNVPVVVDGVPDGIGPGRDHYGERDGDDDRNTSDGVSAPAALCHARAPGGAGTYSCTGSIDVSSDGRPAGGAPVITLNTVVR